ncbi:hypothetical protein MMC09_006283 [Bachmanniomyces sp. S44760]|nr:hypothetical protein [Bachmanniomyces sp. S44760]
MADVSLPLRDIKSSPSHMSESIGTDVFNRHSSSFVREPGPAFVFPMQPPSPDSDISPTNCTFNGEAAGSRRSFNRSRPQRISINALPAFDFNPSGSASSRSPGSPPQSPIKSIAIPSHVGGHRRGGSEFIGGDGKGGGLGLMSSSPTKGEGLLPPPPSSRLGPPGSTRGHAHRRSGAISSHDISTILRPSGENNRPKSGSAPTTPSDPSLHRQFLPGFDRSASQPALPRLPSPNVPPAVRRETDPTSNQARVRVGFSETVEFIPRPLSVISSETSSSLRTLRGDHSVTGSITSIVSAGTSSPPSAKKAKTNERAIAEYNAEKARPSTAGAVMDPTRQASGFEMTCTADERPASAAASPITPSDPTVGVPNYGGRRLFCNTSRDGISSGNPSKRSLTDLSINSRSRSSPGSLAAEPVEHDLAGRSVDTPKIDQDTTNPKRQRKVKSWAGSILQRKPKARGVTGHALDRHVPSPPMATDPMEDFPCDDVSYPNDKTLIVNASEKPTPHPPKMNTDFSNWQPRASAPSQASDALSPLLDLDAALGPMNTPTPAANDSATGNSGSASLKRRMHSSGATGGFSGPGMHYHRRAESAPEMAPINYQSFGLQRLGSNPTMADVFEEEEEEANTQDKPSGEHDRWPEVSESKSSVAGESRKRPTKSIQQARVATTEDVDDEQAVHPSRHAASQSTEPDGARAMAEFGNQIEIVTAEEEPRFSIITKSSDDSTITPTLMDPQHGNRPTSMPMDFAFPHHNSQYASPDNPSSVVSSPDYLNTSFDVPRLNTATSSNADRTTVGSFRTGDYPHDLRVSVDDVPSLTSSASTMISAYPPRGSSSGGGRSSGDQSLSSSAIQTRRTRAPSAGKRASLASLSRLVGSSYGEKSKLSIEERAQSEHSNQSERKKGNRISRLMRFWKSKEKLNS